MQKINATINDDQVFKDMVAKIETTPMLIEYMQKNPKKAIQAAKEFNDYMTSLFKTSNKKQDLPEDKNNSIDTVKINSKNDTDPKPDSI